jgi:hypothetical protein
MLAHRLPAAHRRSWVILACEHVQGHPAGDDKVQHNEDGGVVVDRKNDYYRQSWFNCETGERMFHKDGRNSDPKMHGTSARCRKPKPTAEEPGGQRKTWIRAARDPLVTTGLPCMAAARRRHGHFV